MSTYMNNMKTLLNKKSTFNFTTLVKNILYFHGLVTARGVRWLSANRPVTRDIHLQTFRLHPSILCFHVLLSTPFNYTGAIVSHTGLTFNIETRNNLFHKHCCMIIIYLIDY